jgi:hypothetical protein
MAIAPASWPRRSSPVQPRLGVRAQKREGGGARGKEDETHQRDLSVIALAGIEPEGDRRDHQTGGGEVQLERMDRKRPLCPRWQDAEVDVVLVDLRVTRECQTPWPRTQGAEATPVQKAAESRDRDAETDGRHQPIGKAPERQPEPPELERSRHGQQDDPATRVQTARPELQRGQRVIGEVAPVGEDELETRSGEGCQTQQHHGAEDAPWVEPFQRSHPTRPDRPGHEHGPEEARHDRR